MDTTPILAQYGALGVMVIFAGFAVRTLFQRETQAHEREKERADRMEAEVQRLNAVIQEKMLPILHEATKAISDALQEQRRR
ncbi:hypothetical protein GCM10029976_091070 [Kribbella albertanoniae]|uniref:Uncharacterized protein n=1 Tax=Kribbella albertanoniae TaxID=1266829 RepID=A0A4R4PK71_9ACTN|nr:hypothetical protein [Kribbella albertanoniae]TDC22452.1 hypothetical protein E1261_30880 [Kribbella albertanoniae]